MALQKKHYITGTVVCIMGAILLSACAPQHPNQMVQQQHFICKSLIDGYLKAQHLGQYDLDKIEPTLEQQSPQRQYLYRVSSDHTIRLNSPQQRQLSFNCQQQSAQHYRIELKSTDSQQHYPLLSLDLPPEKEIKRLTAYQLP